MAASRLSLVGIAVMVLALSLPAEGARDVEDVILMIGQSRTGNSATLDTNPYFWGVYVHAADTTSVTVTPPGGAPMALTADGDSFFYDVEGYSSIAGVQTDYPDGTYSFSFDGGADTVDLAYTMPAMPSGFANLTSHVYNEKNVDPDITLAWDSVATYGHGVSVDLFASQPGYSSHQSSYGMRPSVTSWTPRVPLKRDSLEIECQVDVHTSILPAPGTKTTVGGDDFTYRDLSTDSNWFRMVTTIDGDATLDGYTSGADYTIWAGNYDPAGDGSARWSDADFSGDGMVTGADYTLWAGNYTGAPPAAVPEPVSVALVALGGILVVCRRRRR